MKVHEAIRERCQFRTLEEIRTQVDAVLNEQGFWNDWDKVYQVFRYYWHAQDKADLVSRIAENIVDAARDPESIEVLDIGTGTGDMMLGIMESLLTKTRRLSTLDIVEPFPEERDTAIKILSDHAYGGCLRDSFRTVDEVTGRAYDAIVLNNAIYYLEPLVENVLHLFHQLKKGGALIVLYITNNFDYEPIIRGICGHHDLAHSAVCYTQPLRVFLGAEKVVYSEKMIKMLKRFYGQSEQFSVNPLSDDAFVGLLRECSEDGFFDHEHRLLVIRKT